MSLFNRNNLRTVGKGFEKVGRTAASGIEKTGRYAGRAIKNSRVRKELGQEFEERRSDYFEERRIKREIERNARLQAYAQIQARRYGVKSTSVKAPTFQRSRPNVIYSKASPQKKRRAYYFNPRYRANPY